MTSAATANPSESTATGTGSTRLIVGAVVLIACFALVFRQFLRNQFLFAISEPEDWGHTLLVPFIAGYLIYLNRDRLRTIEFRTAWIGLLPIAAGIAWYMFSWVGPPAIKHHNLMGMGAGLTLFGVVLLLCGPRAMRVLWFPIAYLVAFGIKISDRFMNIITHELQDIAAKGAYVLLRIFQFDTEISGNTLTIFYNGTWHPLNVAEACSGMRMLVAFLALGVFVAYTGLPFVWQRVLLVLLGVPVAVFVNILRVVTLGLLSLVDVNFAAGEFHTFIGLLWLVPALLIFLGVMWVLRKVVVEDESGGSASASAAPRPAPSAHAGWLPSFDAAAARAVVVTCIALLVCGLGFEASVRAMSIHLQKRPVPLRRQFSEIPRTFGSGENAWKRFGDRDQSIDAATLEVLGTDKYLSRVYHRGNDAIALHLTYYTDQIDAVPHVPERCFLAGGLSQLGPAEIVPVELDSGTWFDDPGPPNRDTDTPYQLNRFVAPSLSETLTVRMPVGEVGLRVLLFQQSKEMDVYTVAGYFFIANGRATPRATEVRALAFNLTDEFAYYTKVELSMALRGEDAKERFVECARDLLNHALPYIMWCLPDWSEVEAGRYPVSATTDHLLLEVGN